MSKIIDKYKELKSLDSEKLYLFKSGKFYIFVGEDCDLINEYIVLKKVKFSGEYYKCGFPDVSFDDYMRVFSNHHLNIEVVNDFTLNHENNGESVEDIISKLDLNKITPIEALNLLFKFKEILNVQK